MGFLVDPSEMLKQNLNILLFLIAHIKILRKKCRKKIEYLKVSCNFWIKQRSFDVMKKQRCNSFSESLKVFLFDASHHKVNLSVDQFQNFPSQFTLMFLYKTQNIQYRILKVSQFSKLPHREMKLESRRHETSLIEV